MTDLEWKDSAFANEWIARDVLRDMLDLPRRIASVVVGMDRSPARVADIGSGPGDFLARFLDDHPNALGTWTDASEPMERSARVRLERFGSRVDYRIAYMEDLSALPSTLDVVMTSRATHHLDIAVLQRFYAEAYGHLAPGGWLVNLDHTDGTPEWDARLRTARKKIVPPSRQPSEHPHVHDKPRPTEAQHAEALATAGFVDFAMPWKSFVTCLFMARRPD
jgi:SAM-dependent methyltransferase